MLFVTPEYNRSVPGGLKNAIDVGSRPYGDSAFAGKPAAVMSLSPGALGAFGANHHLRQSLVFLDMPRPATARSLCRRGRLAVRRSRRRRGSLSPVLRKLHPGLCRLDRTEFCPLRRRTMNTKEKIELTWFSAVFLSFPLLVLAGSIAFD